LIDFFKKKLIKSHRPKDRREAKFMAFR